MEASKFYDAGLLKQVATNLLNGWGYNFYRLENQLRSDDQLIRAKASWLLETAVARVETEENAYRRRHIPTPTRERPFPDAEVLAAVASLERFAKAVSALIGRVHAQPVPANDRMTERYRQEAATLTALCVHDERLIARCDLLRAALEGLDGEGILANLGPLEAALGAIEEALRERRSLLQ